MALYQYSFVVTLRHVNVFNRTLHRAKHRFYYITMGIINNKLNHVNAEAKVEQKSNKPLKPCCACPETKKIRDDCIIKEGEENCKHYIEAHKACMRTLGFNI